jgi:hypothetical protein
MWCVLHIFCNKQNIMERLYQTISHSHFKYNSADQSRFMWCWNVYVWLGRSRPELKISFKHVILALHFVLFRFVSFSFGIQLTTLFCADRNVLLQWDDTWTSWPHHKRIPHLHDPQWENKVWHFSVGFASRWHNDLSVHDSWKKINLTLFLCLFQHGWCNKRKRCLLGKCDSWGHQTELSFFLLIPCGLQNEACRRHFF